MAGAPLLLLYFFGGWALRTNGHAVLGDGWLQWRDVAWDYTLTVGVLFTVLVAWDVARSFAVRDWRAKWVRLLFEADALNTIPKVIAGSVTTFALAHLMFLTLGGRVLNLDLPTSLWYAFIAYTIIQATGEELIFRYILPKLEFTPSPTMNDALAVVSFGLFHFAAFGGSFRLMAFAMFIGALWQTAVNVGEHSAAYSRYFGLGFAIASHITWNLMVRLTTPADVAPLGIYPGTVSPVPEAAVLGLLLIPVVYALAIVAVKAHQLHLQGKV